MYGLNSMEATIPFNGVGVFQRLYNWFNDYTNGIDIDPTRMDNDTNDIANGLTNCVTRDGQSAATADLPMASFKHLIVGNAALRNQYAAAGQVQDSAFQWGGTSAGTNTITFNTTPNISAYAAGQSFLFLAGGSNTGATTVNISGIGAKNITKNGTNPLVAGDIISGATYRIEYDGTQFQLMNRSNSGAFPIAIAAGTANAITADYTPDVSLTDLTMVAFRATAANTTTTPTFAPDGLTARTIVKNGGIALVAGDIPGNLAICIVQYDLANTRWELINPAVQAPFTDTNPLVKGSSDATKLARLEVDGLTTATTRVLTVQDKDLTIAGISDITLPQDFRLTLTTAVPVTTSDVTAAATIYCTPYKGNRIALYDGTKWNVRTSAEFSLGLGTITNARPYDVFCFDNSGTPTLEFTSWTNDTTRATALVYQDGILVKSGALTRRYLGTFYTTATTTTEDSLANRYLWNYYHRVPRGMRVIEATDAWAYTTATIRQANGSTANQLNFVIGVSEDTVSAQLAAAVRNTNSGVDVAIGIGLDSTTAFASGFLFSRVITKIVNIEEQMTSFWTGYTGAGRHYLSWLEFSIATGTSTWIGDGGLPTRIQSGLQGIVLS